MRAIIVVVVTLLVSSSVSFAQHKPPAQQKPPEKTITFDPFTLKGQLRHMSMLYFLERANEELERSTLPKRSFVPRLVQTVEDERL